MITVRNAQRKLRVSLDELRTFAERALHLCLAERAPQTSALESLDEINIVLVSDARIAALHQQFMNIAGPTDVITFDHGEIFISTETAQRQAREFGTSMDEEIKLYLVHGLLHLHGYDDTTPALRRTMEAAQERVMKRAGVRRAQG